MDQNTDQNTAQDIMEQGSDVEKCYANKSVAAKLRRLADALEAGKPFTIQIAGKRVYMRANPTVEIEYQQDGDEEEIEIEVAWTKR